MNNIVDNHNDNILKKSQNTVPNDIIEFVNESMFCEKVVLGIRRRLLLGYLRRILPPMFCIVIDPDAASFPGMPNAFIPNCSYNKDPIGTKI